MEDQWKIAKYDPVWKDLFWQLGARLRNTLQETALRIDHVGSTSIAGMDAKPIIDIQVSVAVLEDELSYRDKIESLGFQWRSDNPDKSKRYFREVPGSRRTHIHVRRAGSFAEQMTLLFRDYLREHPEDGRKYADEKHRLMKWFAHDRSKYVEGKGPIVWEILHRAHLWAQETGWQPGESDA
ncbi:MAG: GrpB family protein [Paenibacillus macerans]|uniref:GrpB family protein n=1 Tax=Paenibacillus TaxID=44249 RepID=UPI000EC4949F|nr:GrpB family protein [Paenibacillus macerans]MDU7474297.1 GrpB family protein [Paenibacillus macerans]MEC0139592.1 GrpB family protein [Paenibacillus macerans]UMV45454.1 GrpB family protein [Paenibacillus macerans]GBK63977.1 GrpB family protein [Paenibacillus macerans]GBK70290.1 GrpB family protein [Paenibacillus macerans]